MNSKKVSDQIKRKMFQHTFQHFADFLFPRPLHTSLSARLHTVEFSVVSPVMEYLVEWWVKVGFRHADEREFTSSHAECHNHKHTLMTHAHLVDVSLILRGTGS